MNAISRSLILLISILLIACNDQKQVGVKGAENDFSSGIMQLERYGEVSVNNHYDDYLLKNGVKMKVVAGCIINDDIIKHADGYNSTMRRLINQHMGKDIFKEAMAYAREQDAEKKK